MKLKTETEVRPKNTSAISDYCHRCCEKQQNENLRDYNFKRLSWAKQDCTTFVTFSSALKDNSESKLWASFLNII